MLPHPEWGYFPPKETRCKCGCGADITPHMRAALNRIRTAWGKPLSVTSGARCQAYTRKLREDGIPAALKSAHLEGLAADLFAGAETRKFQQWLEERLEGLGVWMEDVRFTSSWAHVQLRPCKTRTFIP